MNYINGSELADKRFIRLENGDLREVKERYIPEVGEVYYCLYPSGGVAKRTYQGILTDIWFLKHNHVFRTYEECEDYKHFLETLDEYTFEPNWDDPKQKKWLLCFDHKDHHIGFATHYSLQYHSPCFESYEKAMAFIDAVGAEAVERYMFDYWR